VRDGHMQIRKHWRYLWILLRASMSTDGVWASRPAAQIAIALNV
jgi:hypothetical protein